MMPQMLEPCKWVGWDLTPIVDWPSPYRKFLCRTVAGVWAAVVSKSLFVSVRSPKRLSTWRLLAHVAGVVPDRLTTAHMLWPGVAHDVDAWRALVQNQRVLYLTNPPLSYVAWTVLSWNLTSLQQLRSPVAQLPWSEGR